MSEKIHIFYASDTSDKLVRQFCRDNDIEISRHPLGYDYIFIDFPETAGQELQAVLALCSPKVVVYLMKYSHLGQGAKAKEMRLAIEATGAKTVVPEKKALGKRGPKPKHGLTDEQIKQYQTLHDRRSVSRQFVIDTILRETGVTLTRHNLRTIFKK